MEENSKSGLYIVAIVGIIAVVGLIVLVMNAGSKSVVYPSGSTQVDDSTGQAMAISRPVPSTNTYTRSEIDALLAKKTTNQQVLNMLDKNCVIYSVSSPDSLREVTGDNICQERSAGTCLFSVFYSNLNTALTSNGATGWPGSGLGIIDRCGVSGPSTETVAYCCRP